MIFTSPEAMQTNFHASCPPSPSTTPNSTMPTKPVFKSDYKQVEHSPPETLAEFTQLAVRTSSQNCAISEVTNFLPPLTPPELTPLGPATPMGPATTMSSTTTMGSASVMGPATPMGPAAPMCTATTVGPATPMGPTTPLLEKEDILPIAYNMAFLNTDTGKPVFLESDF